LGVARNDAEQEDNASKSQSLGVWHRRNWWKHIKVAVLSSLQVAVQFVSLFCSEQGPKIPRQKDVHCHIRKIQWEAGKSCDQYVAVAVLKNIEVAVLNLSKLVSKGKISLLGLTNPIMGRNPSCR